MVESLRNNKLTAYHFLLILFLFLQPLIDIYRIFVDDTIQILGLSLPELCNMGFAAFLGVGFIARYFKNRKLMVFVGVYIAALVAYLIAHCVNILHFDTEILANAERNVVKELYFLLRVYLIPLIYFFILLMEKLSDTVFEKSTKLLAGVISGIIVLTNLCGIGFITYASTLESNDYITRTVFQWFANPDVNNPAYMACKGWFYTGNQISIILFILFPFVIRTAFIDPKATNYALVILQTIAMIMVGTKVAAVGALLIIAAAIIIYFVFVLYRKQLRINKNTVIAFACILAVVTVLFPVSPVIAIQQERSEVYEESSDLAETGKEELEKLLEDTETDPEQGELPEWDEVTIQKFVENLRKYHNGYGIDKAFIDMFSVEDNVHFWHKVVMDPNKGQLDYRSFKEVIYEEVLKKNDNPADKWLGIGYTSNFIYTEKDFSAQIVWFGYLGTLLLLGPYVACVIYILIRACKRLKQAFCYENALFAVSIFGGLVLSVTAGHLFYGVFSIVVFAWLLAGVFRFQVNQEEMK